jgi:hypothetical protein
VLDEVGWQTDTTKYSQYIHNDNVKTVDEPTQTQYLKTATEKYFACDPTIATVNWFLLVDESTRDGKDASGNTVGGGWQSGLLTAGGKGVSTAKPAYTALASDWSAGRSACTGQQINWTPKTSGGSGSGSGSDAGATGKPTFDFSALNGLLSANELYTLDLGLALSVLSPDNMYSLPVFQHLLAPILKKIEDALGPVQGDATVVGLFVWAAQPMNSTRLASLVTARQLNRSSAGKAVIIGRSSAKVTTGHKISLKFKLGKKTTLGAGNLYFVLGIRSAADASKSGYLVAPLGTVKATVKAKKKKK